MEKAKLKAQIKEFAMSEGAVLIGIAPVETYHDYYSGVERRIKETGATLTDFMVSAGDMTFFERISYARNTLPTAKAIIILGVYAYDETAAYLNTQQELRGKTARIYSYYPKFLTWHYSDKPISKDKEANVRSSKNTNLFTFSTQ
jgi:epoxyqueuosine reductase QueG